MLGGFAAGAALLALVLAPARPVAEPDAGGGDAGSVGDAPTERVTLLEQTLRAPDEPNSGDPLELRLTVRHPPGADVRAEPKLENSRWSLLEQNSTSSPGEGDPKTSLDLVFQVFRPGPTELEPFDLLVTFADGETTKLETEAVSTRIRSALPGDEEPELRAAPSPHPVWTRDYTVAWIAGALVASFAVGFIALLLFRRRKDDTLEFEPSAPPDEEALERLEELRESDLLERGRPVEYYVRLSATVRRYLGRRFGFPGTEWTTAEILERLERAVWRGEIELEEIAGWMRRVDRVKFSGLLPSPDEARTALEDAVEIVRQTEPPASALGAQASERDAGEPEGESNDTVERVAENGDGSDEEPTAERGGSDTESIEGESP